MSTRRSRQLPVSDEVAAEVVERLAGRFQEASRYRAEGEIGRGGMGVVLDVWDEDFHRHLAMKVMLGPGEAGETPAVAGSDPKALSRFLEEAQVTGQLDHPGIVPVHELGIDAEGRIYFTMKRVKGETLKDVFAHVAAGAGGWTQTRAVGLLLKVCEAMGYAHAKRVIHRDLKPSNVMVGQFGEVYVMDWGLARVLDRADTKDIRIRVDRGAVTSEVETGRRALLDREPDSPLVTMDGDVVGTPAYMSPEQARGELEALGPRSDVYSVGAVLYHLLTGRMPYQAPGARLDNLAVWALVQRGPPEPVHALAPGVPAELAAICERAMAFEAADRYASMSELAQDLQSYIEGRVVRAHATGAIAELRKWVLRNRSLAAALALLIVSVVAGLAWNAHREAAARREQVLTSDLWLIDHLRDEAGRLWPAEPERVPDLVAWLAMARELQGRRDVHARRLAGLSRAGSGAAPSARDRLTLERRSQLLDGIDAMGAPDGLLERVSERLEFARTVRDRTIDGPEARSRWSEARAAIADPARCPRYAGLELPPQLGLLPIGPDPKSGLWEFAHLMTGTVPERRADGALAIDSSTGLVLVLIPGGTATLGAQAEDERAPNWDPDASEDAAPVYQVRLDPFFLSKYELTQGQWERFTGSNPSDHVSPDEDQRGRHPVEAVSWDDCRLVLERLGLAFPTEAQWEYAARGGTSTIWWTGDELSSLAGAANVADAFCKANGGQPTWTYDEELDDGWQKHAPVGSLRANPFGLHDVHGNVWEWCLETKAPYTLAPTPGTGERAGPASSARLNRGGAWHYVAAAARSGSRRTNNAGVRGAGLGVRPARALEPE